MTSTATLASFPFEYFDRAYLLVEDILAGNVRGDVTSDGVSNSIRTVGVKLSSRISFGLVVRICT
jgi:hypothetical protein